ncbi:MAG: hypothetical protein ACRDKT_06140 [Actinomycetota bacterium]
MTTYQALADAIALHSTPRSRFATAFTSTRWMACALAMAALAVAYVALPQDITRSVYNPMGASALVAFFTGIGRVGSARVWRLLGAGVLSYALADVLGAAGPLGAGDASALTTMAGVLYVAAYGLLAVGLTAIFRTIRTAR